MRIPVLLCLLCLCLQAQPADAAWANTRRLLAEQKWKEAGMALDAWCVEHPQSWEGLRDAAETWMRLHRFDRGAERLRRAVLLKPAEPGLLFNLGICLQNQARWAEAMPVWRELLAVASSDPKVDLLPQIPHSLGICALRLDLTGEAIDALSRAVDMAPENMAFRREYAGTLFEADRFDGALREYQTLLARHPTNPEFLYLAGLAALRSSKDDLAESLLRDARRADSKGANPSAKLAQLYQRQDKPDLAHSLYLEALERNPQSAEALHGLQRIAQSRGDSEDAREYQRRFEEVKRFEDDGSERLRSIKRRLKVNPRDAEALLEQASLHLVEGKFERAMESYALLLSYEPRHEIAVLNMTALLARRGETFAALCELDRVLEGDANNPFTNLERARLLLGMKKPGDAVIAARSALVRMDRKDTRFIDLVEILGEAVFQAKDPGDAADIIAAALPAAPADRCARLALRMLQLNSLGGDASKSIDALTATAERVSAADPLRTALLQQLVRLLDARGDTEAAARWRALLEPKK